ncbi:MAG: hypothetical protein ACXAC7_07935 [Candidatus Hodarchaeales archaeon]|jgi:hypothetical protein
MKKSGLFNIFCIGIFAYFNILNILNQCIRSAVQFGIATMSHGGVNIGFLQNVNIDFAFDVAQLYSGAAIYPVDVRTHTGTISGTAEFADLNAAAFQKLLGGTIAGDVITLTDTDFPATFQLITTVITDSITFKITFPKARSTSMSIPFSRDSHLIPNFGFQVESDASGNVATIDVGDVS